MQPEECEDVPTNSNRAPLDERPESHYKHFAIRREMIVHEDHQINQRITILLTTQSILFAAAAVALTGSYRQITPQFDLHAERKTRFFVTLLSIAGMLLVLAMKRAIWAARLEQEIVRSEVRSEIPSEYKHPESKKYDLPFHCGELKRCLRATGRSSYWGHSYTTYICNGSYAFWVVLLILLWTGLI